MKRLLIALLIVVALVLPLAVRAANDCNPGEILPPCTCSGDCQLTDFVQLFINLYAFGVHLAAPLAVFFILIGAVILVTAAGYANRIDMGKSMITQAVTGLIIVLISWVIVDTSIYLLIGAGKNADGTSKTWDHMVLGKSWFGGFSYPCDNGNLYQGCVGGNVSTLQRELNAIGYTVDVTGSFGPETANAVRHFQEDANTRVFIMNASLACGGKPEGIIVWNAIFGMDCNPPGGTCSVPSDVATEKQIPLTGSVDTKTQAALDNFSKNLAEPYKAACVS